MDFKKIFLSLSFSFLLFNISFTFVQAQDSNDTNNAGNTSLVNELKGKIVLQVEKGGKAYYIDKEAANIHFLESPSKAFQVMRDQGVGVANDEISWIPIAMSVIQGGKDSD